MSHNLNLNLGVSGRPGFKSLALAAHVIPSLSLPAFLVTLPMQTVREHEDNVHPRGIDGVFGCVCHAVSRRASYHVHKLVSL